MPSDQPASAQVSGSTSQATAAGSNGAAFAAVTLFSYLLNLAHVQLTPEAASAVVVLLSAGAHALVARYAAKQPGP